MKPIKPFKGIFIGVLCAICAVAIPTLLQSCTRASESSEIDALHKELNRLERDISGLEGLLEAYETPDEK